MLAALVWTSRWSCWNPKQNPPLFPQYHQLLDIMSTTLTQASCAHFENLLGFFFHAILPEDIPDCMTDQRTFKFLGMGPHVYLLMSHEVYPIVAISGFNSFYFLEPFLDTWLFYSLMIPQGHSTQFLCKLSCAEGTGVCSKKLQLFWVKSHWDRFEIDTTWEARCLIFDGPTQILHANSNIQPGK